MRRKIEQQLQDFLEHDRRAILLTGARQIGKTFSIRKVGRELFANHFVEINFVEQPEALQLFENPTEVKTMLTRLSLLAGKQLNPGKTLIFFDEVQECKEIVTAIKFLVDEGSFRYVLSGSLLGVELHDIKSVPVGYLSIQEMHPLDLEEFFAAIGVGDDIIDTIRKHYNDRTAVDTLIHDQLMKLVWLYQLVGGMPAAVQQYIESHDLQKVVGVQRDIVQLYRKDITRYADKDKLRIKEIFDLLPSELNAKNKRFILKNMNEQKRFERVEPNFVWLKDSAVAIPVYNVEEPRVPLLLNKQRNLFKLFANDVGLLASQYTTDLHLRMLSGNVNVNYGSLIENFVAQELSAHGFQNDSRGLYYFNSKKQGELDFVVEHQGHVLPIEVKSGKDYHRHNALSNVTDNAGYDIPVAYVLCADNVSTKGCIVYLPLYMLMFLQADSAAPMVYMPELPTL